MENVSSSKGLVFLSVMNWGGIGLVFVIKIKSQFQARMQSHDENCRWLVHLNIQEGHLLDKRIFHCIPLSNLLHFPPPHKCGRHRSGHLFFESKIETDVMIILRWSNDKSASRDGVVVTKSRLMLVGTEIKLTKFIFMQRANALQSCD